MNAFLKLQGGDWIIVSVRTTTEGGFAVRSKLVYGNKNVPQVSPNPDVYTGPSKQDAVRRLKVLFANKRGNNTGSVVVDIVDVPEHVLRCAEPDLETRVTAEELVRMLEEARKGRLVWFSQAGLVGIEDQFDYGIEYLAVASDRTSTILEVWNKYGELVCIDRARLEKIELTEEARQAGAK